MLRDGQTNAINPDNPNMTAGFTFFGQFVAHDLSRIKEESLLELTDPRRTTNFRTAELDLDNLYGDGPDRSPDLYDSTSEDIKFRVEVIPGSEQVSRKGAVRFDVPRDPNKNAIIADSRNDENVIISQFHVAMLKLHNAVVDRLRHTAHATRSGRERFNEARRQVTWHYQWIILNKFLPLTIGQDRVDEILQNGPRFYRLDDRTEDSLFRNSTRRSANPSGVCDGRIPVRPFTSSSQLPDKLWTRWRADGRAVHLQRFSRSKRSRS